jgi:hypothetical protein
MDGQPGLKLPSDGANLGIYCDKPTKPYSGAGGGGAGPARHPELLGSTTTEGSDCCVENMVALLCWRLAPVACGQESTLGKHGSVSFKAVRQLFVQYLYP